ncbi:MAG: DeoR/GlpR family DNA-binding transcription regulator [Blautia sp.]|nr:DeoR/GlpR family DNA-binding transcription regulator [Blautia sp.]MDY3998905.1 DeoR/GlpR family DNA-binding transcription regulator [Blautia sp.]
MLALERRNLILEKLQLEKRVVVSELSQMFDVSEETIRRDLDKLEKEGLATKSYGGAVINEDVSIDLPFNVRKNQNVAGKQKMAEITASLVQEGDHIFLDASTTAVFVAKALKEKERLTVITNSVEILLELSDVSGWNIISTGGVMKEGYLAFLGSKTEEAIRSYYVDKVIFSCKALDHNWGIMESQEPFGTTKKAMVASAREKFLVIDSTKFDQTAFSVAGNLRDVDVVVTDIKPSEKWLKHFEELGVECKYPSET